MKLDNQLVKKFTDFYGTRTVSYRVDKSTPLVSILIHVHLVHTHTHTHFIQDPLNYPVIYV
jgi:hypothetical protein